MEALNEWEFDEWMDATHEKEPKRWDPLPLKWLAPGQWMNVELEWKPQLKHKSVEKNVKNTFVRQRFDKLKGH